MPTKVDKLKAVIGESGLKKSYIAECLGLSRAGYLKKENGESEFVASEIQALKRILSLSNSQVTDIFLS